MVVEALKIRRLREEDIASLAYSLRETPEAQLLNRWREQQLGWREVHIAFEGDRPVATVSTRITDRTMHLIALEVAPDLRGRGIGRQMVDYVVELAREAQCRRVFLEVRVDNAARRLYHRAGFRRVGEPFINTWWLYTDDGGRHQVDEESLRMVKRLRP